MILRRTFKYITYLGAIFVVLFCVLGFFRTFLFFTYFKVFTFSLVFAFTFFTAYIFLSRSDWYPLLKIFTSVLIFIPIIVHGFAFFTPSLLEESWPLLIGFLVLQSGIVMYSELGYFSSQKQFSKIDYLMLLMIAAVLLPIFLVFLLNIATASFYSFMLPAVVVLFLILLIVVIAKERTKAKNN